jgi:hypothetical protein
MIIVISSSFCLEIIYLLFLGSSLGYLFGYLNVGFTNFIIGALLGGLPLQILMIIIGDNFKRYIF